MEPSASDTLEIRVVRNDGGVAHQVETDRASSDTSVSHVDGEVSVPNNASQLLIHTPIYAVRHNDGVEYAAEIRLTLRTSIGHGQRPEDGVRATLTAQPTGDEERRIGCGQRSEDGTGVTPTAPPHVDESVQKICQTLTSTTKEKLMQIGLTEPELDIIRRFTPQLQRHYKHMVNIENLSDDLETYQPGFYFVSNKNPEREDGMLHCTALIVREGEPRYFYFDSLGNVPVKLRGRVEWSQLNLQQQNVNTCAFHCLYVFDMWTKWSTLSDLPQEPDLEEPDLPEFINGLYTPTKKPNLSIKGSYFKQGDSSSEHSSTPEKGDSSSGNPEQGGSSSEHSCTPAKGASCSDDSCYPKQDESQPNFDHDEKVMSHYRMELLPHLQQFINAANVWVTLHPDL
ncbi:hypothetical protein SNE40_008681 [Patella caerulea]|uniref:Uncharacterized protein n=1 Tax=Patella caerulea TaxID=87958 RepID=A0AAN8JMN5_PATCE